MRGGAKRLRQRGDTCESVFEYGSGEMAVPRSLLHSVAWWTTGGCCFWEGRCKTNNYDNVNQLRHIS